MHNIPVYLSKLCLESSACPQLQTIFGYKIRELGKNVETKLNLKKSNIHTTLLTDE